MGAGLRLLGALAVFRVITDPRPGSLGALCVAALVGFGSGWWISHRRHKELALVLSTLVFVAVVVEAAVPQPWHHLLVDPSTWHQLAAALHVASEGRLLGGCVLVGVAGTLERLALGRRWSIASTTHSAEAVIPAFALVTWSIAVSPGAGAALLGAGIIVLAGAVLVCGDAEVRGSMVDSGTRAGLPAGWHRRLLLVLGPPLIVFWALVAAVWGSGAVGAGSPSASSTAPTTEALVTNVVGFAQEDPNVLLFRARTAVPTYWQVAILTEEANGSWGVPATVAREMRQSGHHSDDDIDDPTAVSAHSALVADVTIEAYRGYLLPVPIGTTQVRSPLTTQFVDGAVVQTQQTKSGERYVVHVAPSASTSSLGVGSNAESTVPEVPAAESIPPEVRRLARGVARGALDQPEMVQRLVNWFQSGRFRYTTAEQPSPPPGVSSVVAFLTQGKTGNCQTFTDAFAAMAQSLGVPVRVAIGFTSGTSIKGGESLVTGADAHTWPQVYLGATVGWESVEPTPPSTVAVTPPLGVRGVNPAPTPTTQPNPSPGATPGGTNPAPRQVPTTSPTTTLATAGAAVPTTQAIEGAGSSTSAPWLRFGGILLAILVVGGVVFSARRRNERTHRDPYEKVIKAWGLCESVLAKVGFGCPVSRTHVDHAGKLREVIALSVLSTDAPRPLQTELEQLANDVETVAVLESEARYGGWDVGNGTASAAASAAQRVRAVLRRRAVRRALRDVLGASKTPGGEALGTQATAQASSQGGADEARGAFRGADPAGIGR
jgi:hypothetical protein